MSTVRQAAWNGVAVGGLYSSFNIGVHFDSTDEAVRKFGSDFLHGLMFGAGMASLMGLSVWLRTYGDQQAMLAQQAQNGAYQVSAPMFQRTVGSYAQAQDLATMERLFGNMTGGGIPMAPLQLDQASQAALAQGISRHIAAMASVPVTTAEQVAERAHWMTVLTIYTNATGIQLSQPTLGNAMAVLRNIGYPVPAQLTEEAARATMNQMARDFVNMNAQQAAAQGAVSARAAAAPGAQSSAAAAARPVAPIGPQAAGEVDRGIRLVNPGSSNVSVYRSWNALSLRARNAGTRATSIEEAAQTRRELTVLQGMMNTPKGAESLEGMRGELGDLAPQQLSGLRRSYTAAIARVDRQIADSLRREAPALASKPLAAGDITELYVRIGKLQNYKNLLGTMRANGATLEAVNAAAPAVEEAQAALDAQLAKQFAASLPSMGSNAAERLGLVRDFRAFLGQNGFDVMMPKTSSVVDGAIGQLSRTAPRAAA